jgi:hypothetical protein
MYFRARIELSIDHWKTTMRHGARRGIATSSEANCSVEPKILAGLYIMYVKDDNRF